MGIGILKTSVLALSFCSLFATSGQLVNPIDGAVQIGQKQWNNMEYVQQQIQRTIEEKRLREKKEKDELTAQEKRKKKYLQECIRTMTLEEKIAQMMIMTHEKDMTTMSVRNNQPGGVIFFGFDFSGKTVEQVRGRVDSIQEASKVPILICVDEEGGSISRVSGLRESSQHFFQSARTLGQTMDNEYIQEQTTQKTELLRSMGINVNFDPVADITVNPRAYMYERSAGSDEATVSLYVGAVVEQMQQDNMISCLKHFPGYGENGNTHNNYIIDKRSMKEYEQSDLIPFQVGIQKGTDMIMVSHLVMQEFNKKMPASLSKKVHQYIREEMQFDGVIIADDLNMEAVLSQMDLAEASEKAVEAGNDMFFSADFEQSMLGIQNALKKGTVTEAQIDESVYRILDMKYKHHLITRSEK